MNMLLEEFKEQFDKVICAHTLEHISDDKLFWKKNKTLIKT